MNYSRNNFRAPLFKAVLTAGIFAVAVSAPGIAFGQNDSSPTTCKAPDNTAHNKKHNTTADQQGNSSADIAMTANIRKSVMADKSLSTYAHNVKIITSNGMVTLRGPVKSDQEKQTIEAKAVEAAGGADKVQDRITVKASQ